MSLPFKFPPEALNQWCSLDISSRKLWLDSASERFFRQRDGFTPSTEPGREVIIDGSIIDNRLGFYCAVGEAVNGPGGYFGKSMQSFDDCLFAGFGLEYPYTLV